MRQRRAIQARPQTVVTLPTPHPPPSSSLCLTSFWPWIGVYLTSHYPTIATTFTVAWVPFQMNHLVQSRPRRDADWCLRDHDLRQLLCQSHRLRAHVETFPPVAHPGETSPGRQIGFLRFKYSRCYVTEVQTCRDNDWLKDSWPQSGHGTFQNATVGNYSA